MNPATAKEMLALMPRLRRFLIGLCGSVDLADDLLQDTYERSIIKIDQWQQGSRLDAWMFTIARSIFLNHLRSDQRRAAALPDLKLVSDLEANDDDAERDLASAIRQGLGELAPDQRDALLLVVVEGFSYQEAGRILALPQGTVASRVARGRRNLLTIMNKFDAEEMISETNGGQGNGRTSAANG